MGRYCAAGKIMPMLIQMLTLVLPMNISHKTPGDVPCAWILSFTGNVWLKFLAPVSAWLSLAFVSICGVNQWMEDLFIFPSYFSCCVCIYICVCAGVCSMSVCVCMRVTLPFKEINKCLKIKPI